MREENTFANNRAEISGKIVSDFLFSHEIYGEEFYRFYVEAPRLSNVMDALPVTLSERLWDRRRFVAGSDVDITGQIRSYNHTDPETGKSRLLLTVFTRDIRPAENAEGKCPNAVYLNGFVCKPPVYRETPFGREICDLLIAVNRSFNKSDYIPAIAWGRNARYCAKLPVGENVEAHGRMQSRPYQKKLEDGTVQDKMAYELSISQIETVKPRPAFELGDETE